MRSDNGAGWELYYVQCVHLYCLELACIAFIARLRGFRF